MESFKNHIKYFAQINKDVFYQLITGIVKIEGYENKEIFGKWDEKHCRACANYNTELCESCTEKHYMPCDKNDKSARLISCRKNEIISNVCTLKRNSILVFLYYHFCNVNTKTGIINAVFIPDMVNTLNISYNTVLAANKKLEEIGLLEVKKIGRGLITVKINKYNSYYDVDSNNIKRIDEKGNEYIRFNGVIKITRELFFELIKNAKKSNQIRLALFKVLIYDNHNVRNFKEDYTISIIFNKFKEVLQGKLCNKEINNLLKDVQFLFDDNSQNCVNEFKIKEDFNIHKKLKKLKDFTNKKVFSIFKNLNNNQKNDLQSLCNEFDVENIVKIINLILDKYNVNLEFIKNKLGLIRTEIKKQITLKLAHLTYTGIAIFTSEESLTF